MQSVAGMFGLFGRRRKSLSSAATKRRLTSAAQADIAESEADIARLHLQVEDIKSQMEQDADALTEQWTNAAGDIQQTKIAPKKTDIDVQLVALAWAPSWEVTYEDAAAAPAPTACRRIRGSSKRRPYTILPPRDARHLGSAGRFRGRSPCHRSAPMVH